MAFPPLWVAIARRFSKSITWVAGSALLSAAFVTLCLLHAAPLALVLALYLAMGAGKASVLMHYYSMTADAVDYGQWKQGRRVEAYSFGFLSMSTNAGLGRAGGLIGPGLQWAGSGSHAATGAPQPDP